MTISDAPMPVVVAGVAAVGPGDRGYHGGQWAVYIVSWNVDMYAPDVV